MRRNAPIVFLSCVTEEFGEFRTELARALNTTDYKVIHQDDFPGSSGGELFQFLDENISKSAAVVHVIGCQAARLSSTEEDWGPPRQSRDKIVPLIRKKLPKPHPKWETLSFTQWEAWLAIYHGCKLFCYNFSNGKVLNATESRTRVTRLKAEDVASLHRQSQQAHASLLIECGRHVGNIAFDATGLARRARKALFAETALKVSSDLSKHLAAETQSSDAAESRGRIKSLRKEIEKTAAYDQSAPIRLLQSAKFYGREWLYADVVKWLGSKSKTESLYWLEAEAGFGKSSFCAQLGRPWGRMAAVNVAAAVFLEPGFAPIRLVIELCGQLRKACPEYLEGFNEAWNAISWKDYPVPSELEIGGEDQLKFAEMLLEKLLIKPLRAGELTGKSTRQLIIIDGLDEVVEWRRGTVLLPLRPLFDRLFEVHFPQFRILMTSRPARMYPILKELIEAKQPRCKNFEKAENEKDRFDDARKVAVGELVSESRRWGDREILKTLIAKSRASMLYLHFMIAEIKEKKLSPDGVDDFPNGLSMYYLRKMNEYFPGEEFRSSYERHVRPCLELIAAGERTDLTSADIEACLGTKAVNALRSSMKSMIVERNQQTGSKLIVERSKYVDGRPASVFEPFHLSFLDWLLGREFDGREEREKHRFRVSAQAGDERLAEWCWREYGHRKDQDPDPGLLNEYWARQGVDHLLNAFGSGSRKHRGDRTGDQYRHYEFLKQAVEVLGWVNRSSAGASIVAAMRPAIAHALDTTLGDDSPQSLKNLESLKQDLLFDIYQGVSATGMVEQVIFWIGSTQVGGWQQLVARMLQLHDYVIRHAAASGQAARFKRQVRDGKQAEAEAEVQKLLRSKDADHQEMGAYTVGELASELIGKQFDDVCKWLKMVSKNSRYFCQSMMGDLLIDLTLRDRHKTVEKLIQEKAVEPFWKPIWQYTELDVVSVLAQRKYRKAKPLDLAPALQDAIEAECRAIDARHQAIARFAQSGTAAETELFRQIGEMLHQTELEQTDKDVIVRWITRGGVTTEQRITSTVDFLVLMFTHPLWEICEEGAAILDLVSTRADFQDVCMQILDRLIDSLENAAFPSGLTRWRVILGTSEASYLLRRHDRKRSFSAMPEEKAMERLEYCWRRYHAYPNCHVRALLAENVVIVMTSLLHDGSDGGPNEALKFVQRWKDIIGHWLKDDDIWVLEHVYQLFHTVAMQDDPELEGWIDDQQCLIDSGDSLLAKAAALSTNSRWYDLDRGEFIDHIQSVRTQN